LCESSAEIDTDYEGKWLTGQELAQDLPVGNMDKIQALKADGYIDTRDSLYAYLVRVYDFVPAGEPTPIEQTEARIRQIIIIKRKQKLLEDLEVEVLKEGWNKQMIKIYRKNED